MNKTTIVVSRKVYIELLKKKEKISAKSMSEIIERILLEYRKLKRILSILEMIEKNKTEKRLSLEELLEDRRRWG